MTDGDGSLRIDKWLWAARFFKTRSLAAEAVTGGKVRVGGQRTKPACTVRVDDELRIRRGACEMTVRVRALSARRGPAKVAQSLYEETEFSVAARQALVEQRRLADLATPSSPAKPSKRARRQIVRFTRKHGD